MARGFCSLRAKDRSGYIYILSNPAFPYLKIGHSKNTPEERRTLLSGLAASPCDFEVAFELYVADCRMAERQIHSHFSSKALKHEFFDVPFDEAMKFIQENIKGERRIERLRRVLETK